MSAKHFFYLTFAIAAPIRLKGGNALLKFKSDLNILSASIAISFLSQCHEGHWSILFP